MIESGLQAMPFRPPALNPLAAHLGNVLHTRRVPWLVRLGEVAGTLRPAPARPPFTTVCAVELLCGTALWRINVGPHALRQLHSALANVPDDTLLPRELRQAVLEVLAAPVITFARRFLGLPASVQSVLLDDEATAPPAPDRISLPLELCLEPLSGADDGALRIPVSVDVPDRDCAMMLLECLKTLPRRDSLHDGTDFDPAGHANHALLALPVPVAVDAGSMRLTVSELTCLTVDDILLPDEYHAMHGLLLLRLLSGEAAEAAEHTGTSFLNRTVGTSSQPAVTCTVNGFTATVTGFIPSLPQQETAMPASNPHDPQPNDNPTPDTDAPDVSNAPGVSGGPNVGDIEVMLHFELERRVMTVQDIGALAPGYTFALGCDPMESVTLRVNGKSMGTGRLVDLNGVLGVQITQLETV